MRNIHQKTQNISAWQNHSTWLCLLLLDNDIFLQSDTSTKEIKTKTKRTNKTKKPLLHTHTATIIEQENISTISKQIPQSYPSIGWVSIV